MHAGEGNYLLYVLECQGYICFSQISIATRDPWKSPPRLIFTKLSGKLRGYKYHCESSPNP